jgi:hypothetical protein
LKGIDYDKAMEEYKQELNKRFAQYKKVITKNFNFVTELLFSFSQCEYARRKRRRGKTLA